MLHAANNLPRRELDVGELYGLNPHLLCYALTCVALINFSVDSPTKMSQLSQGTSKNAD